MQIGYDVTGKVWLSGDAVPVDWNGLKLTVVTLDDKQLAQYSSLPPDRAGTIFDGLLCIAVLKAVVPITVTALPIFATPNDLATYLRGKSVI